MAGSGPGVDPRRAAVAAPRFPLRLARHAELAVIGLVRNYMAFHAAARLLQETSLPIGRISRQVGYRSEAAFSIAFKRNRGVQPREARSIQRA